MRPSDIKVKKIYWKRKAPVASFSFHTRMADHLDTLIQLWGYKMHNYHNLNELRIFNPDALRPPPSAAGIPSRLTTYGWIAPTAGFFHSRDRLRVQDTPLSHDIHLPMQNWLKIESSKSSVAVLPTISPTASTAIRRSIATSSSVTSACNASSVRRAAARARFSAS